MIGDRKLSSEAKKHPLSLLVAATAMCAGLYAVGSYLTAYIPSPWGVGQFRPAVIIPVFFAVIFGPMTAGVGAAMGTFIADSLKYGYPYPGSYLAAVWGNLIGFYLFGWLLQNKFSWRRFVTASNITLTLANAIVAFLYVFLFKVLYLGESKYVSMPLDVQMFFSIGLTIWWFVTMLPFVLLVTPLLIRAVAIATPSIVPEDVRLHSLKEDLPKTTFTLAFLIPGLIMLLVGLAMSYTVFGDYVYTYFKEPATTVIRLMFYVSGAILAVLGVFVYAGQMLFWKKTTSEKEETKAEHI
jgi:MFS family permease